MRTLVPIMTAAHMLDAGKGLNPAFLAQLHEASIKAAAPYPGTPLDEFVEAKMELHMLLLRDGAYPTPSAESIEHCRAWLTADYARGGVDWDGSGGARQMAAVETANTCTPTCVGGGACHVVAHECSIE